MRRREEKKNGILFELTQNMLNILQANFSAFPKRKLKAIFSKLGPLVILQPFCLLELLGVGLDKISIKGNGVVG